MRTKKMKAYWIKKRERFDFATEARSRAAALRNYKHVMHVTVDRTTHAYQVNYSIARSFMEDCIRAGVKL
jgi:hypothetical protein